MREHPVLYWLGIVVGALLVLLIGYLYGDGAQALAFFAVTAGVLAGAAA
jgi:hypothetical protein